MGNIERLPFLASVAVVVVGAVGCATDSKDANTRQDLCAQHQTLNRELIENQCAWHIENLRITLEYLKSLDFDPESPLERELKEEVARIRLDQIDSMFINSGTEQADYAYVSLISNQGKQQLTVLFSKAKFADLNFSSNDAAKSILIAITTLELAKNNPQNFHIASVRESTYANAQILSANILRQLDQK